MDGAAEALRACLREEPEQDVTRAAGRRAAIVAAVRGAGFAFCALDLEGFASGRSNVLLDVPAVPGR